MRWARWYQAAQYLTARYMPAGQRGKVPKKRLEVPILKQVSRPWKARGVPFLSPFHPVPFPKLPKQPTFFWELETTEEIDLMLPLEWEIYPSCHIGASFVIFRLLYLVVFHRDESAPRGDLLEVPSQCHTSLTVVEEVLLVVAALHFLAKMHFLLCFNLILPLSLINMA